MKLAPKKLLWTVILLSLFVHSATSVVLLKYGSQFHHTVRGLEEDRATMEIKEAQLRKAIQEEQDMEQLRRRAIGTVTIVNHDWNRFLDSMKTLDDFAWAQLCVSIGTVVLLAVGVHALRINDGAA
jgi:hypothetical protein